MASFGKDSWVVKEVKLENHHLHESFRAGSGVPEQSGSAHQSQGLHSEVLLTTGQLQQQACILSQSWRLDVPDQGAGWLVSSEVSLLGLQVAACVFTWCFPLSESMSTSPLLIRSPVILD